MKSFKITSRPLGQLRVTLSVDGSKRFILINDSKDECENFRSMCRELHKFEKTLGASYGKSN